MSGVGFYVPGHRGTIRSKFHRAERVTMSAEATKFTKCADLDKSYDLVPIAIETLGS